MATIKKTIQNLKPGKQYLLTVKPKDADINTTYDPTSAVRFVVPTDLTQPDRKSTRLNSSHVSESRMPSSA